MRRLAAAVLSLGCFLGFLVSPAFAQGTGQINGALTDSTGGVIPGATVSAVESATGIKTDTVTGANGRYSFPSIRPTTYEIRAELTGFKTVRRTGITLQANQNLTVNITLELGELAETVTVAGEAATVDISSATISEVVDHARIVELPIAGREVARLQTLVAGTVLASVSEETGKSIPGRSAFPPTAPASARTRTGWTARATPTRITRRIRASRSPTRSRSSRFRRPTTARRTATVRAPSSTSSPGLGRTLSMAARSSICAIASSTRKGSSQPRRTISSATSTVPSAAAPSGGTARSSSADGSAHASRTAHPSSSGSSRRPPSGAATFRAARRRVRSSLTRPRVFRSRTTRFPPISGIRRR